MVELFLAGCAGLLLLIGHQWGHDVNAVQKREGKPPIFTRGLITNEDRSKPVWMR